MKRLCSFLIVIGTLFCAVGCGEMTYDGFDSVYYGFADDYIVGKTYDEIVDRYGLPQKHVIDESLVGVDDENALGYIDKDNRIRYRVRYDVGNAEDDRDAYIFITLDQNKVATAWRIHGNTENNSTGFGLKRYRYDLAQMTGKTAPEIRDTYGFFEQETYNDVNMDDPIVDSYGKYILRNGDGELGWSDEIFLLVYFNKEGVATYFIEQYGYPGG